ncbi:esterase family protein [Olsenella sp. Marseille-QA0557]|uniref:esterase family protein n=1 Tax=Olsenella sp. Marseille-QA0557 TaxID=3378782 RepID=UPI003D14E4A3
MKKDQILQNSVNLKREMHVTVHGEAGYPIIVFPSQNAMASNWEDFGMIDVLADYLESNQIQLFCLDSVDAETWSNTNGNNEQRAETQEAYYRYVCDEVVPLVHQTNGSQLRPLLAGTSLGATQAVILMLRRPDLFQGCIALSGTYDSADFFGDWMNETLYLNAPTTFLPNMASDHPYVDLYNKRQIILCAGQGAWEDESVRTQGLLDAAFRDKGIDAWCDYWGDDVSHDWPWWHKQIRYFLPLVLDKVPAESAEQTPATKEEIPVSTEPAKAAQKAAAKAAAVMATPAPAPATKPVTKPAAKKTSKKATSASSTQKSSTTKAATVKTTTSKTGAAKKTTASTSKTTAAKSSSTKKTIPAKKSVTTKTATTSKAKSAAKVSSSVAKTTATEKKTTKTAAKPAGTATTKATAAKRTATKKSSGTTSK